MKCRPRLLLVAALVLAMIAVPAVAQLAANTPHYLITNNDYSLGNSASFFTINGGTLTRTAQVQTGGKGNDGIGSIATKRISIFLDPTQSCAFLGDANSNDVAGISITTLISTGTFKGSTGDSGSAAGIAVVNNGTYLYAGYSGSHTIATYQIQAGCQLKFLQDVAAMGISGTPVLDMAANRTILVVSYGDGSIESFNVSSGVPVSNGDLQFSSGVGQNSFPEGVDIDRTGHYAAFGGSGNPAVIETSDISSGKLSPTVVHSNLGPNTGSEAIRISPDNTLIYFTGFSSGELSTAFFNASTGAVSNGCTSLPVRGGHELAGLATSLPIGSGAVIYVAEIEVDIGILQISVNGSSCSITESSKSPVLDTHTITLESIGVFPPRPF